MTKKLEITITEKLEDGTNANINGKEYKNITGKSLNRIWKLAEKAEEDNEKLYWWSFGIQYGWKE